MNNFRKILALMLGICLLMGTAMAETAGTEVTDAVASTDSLTDETVIAKVNGVDVAWAEAKSYYDNYVGYYGSYYDLTDTTNVNMFRAYAMENAIVHALTLQTAAEQGLDQYTDEEKQTVYEQADADWNTAMDNYVSANAALTDTSTEEEKTAAYAEAEKYYNDLGYTQDIIRASYLDSDLFTRVKNFVCKDVAVTDEEVELEYQSRVDADKALYENDLDAYQNYNSQVQMYNAYYGYNMDSAWYRPAGMRYVKHILIPIDDTLMSTYTDLQARMEEQMNADDTAAETTDAAAADASADATEEPTATEAPVTQADLDNAKADILASISDKTTEIYAKIDEGASFEDLIAEYGVKADGTASDPGMSSENYPNGYEVAPNSTTYVPEFVEAAFSVDNVGDVSSPYISSYGVHIVKYMADIPAGPIEMTDDQRETMRSTLLTTKQDAAMTAWESAATVEYTGAVMSITEFEAAQAAAAEEQTASADDTSITFDSTEETTEPEATEEAAQ